MFKNRSLLFFSLYLRNLGAKFNLLVWHWEYYLYIERKVQGVSPGLKHGFGGDRPENLWNESIMLYHR